MSQIRKILVTSALPYANGPIHLGHMLEYIQTDIWVRFQKLRGHQCLYVCADDAHGTPIMLKAEQLGLTPEQMIAQVHAEHSADFADFAVGFDNYYSTHSDENRHFSAEIYQLLQQEGYIAKRAISQLFDPVKQMFLPDRFVKGDCPKCGTSDQNGDNCEACGATYSPTELKNPRSAVSGATPIERESEHYFFKLPEFTALLREWIEQGSLQEQVANKLQEWFEAGLQEWCISRDAPYFGFEIPDAPNKYFYVWLDAPIGYIASFRNLCERRPDLDFADFWAKDATAELYHFIGKDIVNFHALFWPAMLTGAGFRRPNALFVHGYVTVNGAKMSKSRGTFITARAYLDALKPEYLRYYYAAKLNSSVEDLDLNLDDFVQKVNSDLVGKLINIASRCSGFIERHFDGKLASQLPDLPLWQEFVVAGEQIAADYEAREYAKAMREIMTLADKANQYIADAAPWALVKQPERLAQVQPICTQALNLFRLLCLYLQPVLPLLTQQVGRFLNTDLDSWATASVPLLASRIEPYQPLMQRIEPAQISAMLAASPQVSPQPKAVPVVPDIEPIKPEIDFADFDRVDLRVARILKAEAVTGADKLLRLQLDLGNEQRQVLAGIKSAYQPEQLEGRLTVMVANLAPRKMKFGMSEGMVLAAGPGGSELFILEPDSGATPGMRVK